MVKRRIYALKGLPPEVVAVAFAKCSRSPEAFDEIAEELNADKSRQFHEKWVVGYGHSSVAEHAVISLAIEDVSILATKVLEDNRLASYTEKSTRYQVFDKESYYKPAKLKDSKIYVSTADFIMETYQRLMGLIIEFLKKKYPEAKDIEIKNKACDNLRYMLPVASLTNLGMTINARNLEWGIVKLLTHPLDEIREIGEELKEAALKVTPTLIKYTKFNDYLSDSLLSLKKISSEKIKIENKKNEEGAVLVEYDPDAEDKIVSALLYRGSSVPYSQIKEEVKKMSSEDKAAIIEEALKGMDKFDRPLREFENVYYTFDVLMDYGAFRDVQRHRMCTQTNQSFTPTEGYDVPAEVEEAGMKEDYVSCMEKAKSAYDEIAKEHPEEASYILPLAYKKRTLMTMNLRELFHFIKLRSTKHGHISYRRIAWQMWDEINKVHPTLGKWIEVDRSE